MNRRQENKLAMYRAVRTTSATAEAQAAGQEIPALGVLFEEFNQQLLALEAIMGTATTKGATASKRTLRETLAEQATRLAAALLAYANGQKNRELAAKMDFTHSDFSGVSDEEAVTNARTVLAEAQKALPELGDYKVDEVRLTQLQAALQAFTEAIPQPRVTRAQSKTITEQRAQAFATLDALLSEQLDGVMAQCADTRAGLVADYRNARIIVDLGSRHEAETPAAPTTPTAATPVA